MLFTKDLKARISADMNRKLQVIAKAEFRPLAQITRMALTDYIDSWSTDNGWTEDDWREVSRMDAAGELDKTRVIP